jgi:uncharacterized protein YlxP (DUF503 family)
VKERLRARHNVAVSELEEHPDVWQRASLAVVSVAGHRNVLDAMFQSVVRETESHIPGHLVETGREFLEGSDGGPGGWEGEFA